MLILRQKNINQSLKKFLALPGSSITVMEQDNISPDHSSYCFPMKFGQNFQKTLLVIL